MSAHDSAMEAQHRAHEPEPLLLLNIHYQQPCSSARCTFRARLYVRCLLAIYSQTEMPEGSRNVMHEHGDSSQEGTEQKRKENHSLY